MICRERQLACPVVHSLAAAQLTTCTPRGTVTPARVEVRCRRGVEAESSWCELALRSSGEKVGTDMLPAPDPS